MSNPLKPEVIVPQSSSSLISKLVFIGFFPTILLFGLGVMDMVYKRGLRDGYLAADRQQTPILVEKHEDPEESGTWVARSGVTEIGTSYIEFNGVYLDGEPETAYLVGSCPSLGVRDYVSGRWLELFRDADGWYRLNVATLPEEDCELTLSLCEDPNDPACWMQFGPDRIGSASAGPYRSCYFGDCTITFPPR